MKFDISKFIDGLPIFDSVPDYDIMSPVETATKEELENGLAIPVSVTMSGVMENIMPANMIGINVSSAFFGGKEETERFNRQTEAFINENIIEKSEIISRGVIAVKDGRVEIRWCEDMYDCGIPDEKTLTILSFGAGDPDTAALVRTETSDWQNYVRHESTEAAYEMFMKMLAELSENGDIPADDEIFSGRGTKASASDDTFDDNELREAGEGVNAAFIFSKVFPRTRLYFGNRLVSGFFLITDEMSNGIGFPGGGRFRVRYTVDAMSMTAQRAEITIDVKPLKALTENKK